MEYGKKKIVAGVLLLVVVATFSSWLFLPKEHIEEPEKKLPASQEEQPQKDEPDKTKQTITSAINTEDVDNQSFNSERSEYESVARNDEKEKQPVRIILNRNTETDNRENDKSTAENADKSEKEFQQESKETTEAAPEKETNNTSNVNREEDSDIPESEPEVIDEPSDPDEERAYQEAHREIYVTNGGGVYYGYNTYPWQEKCPEQQDWYYSTINGRVVGGYVCECVSYAGWKAYENYGVYISWGNAYNWDNRARALGYTVDHNPEAGTIGQTDSGIYGVVFWVDSVNEDGSINISEYNNYSSTGQLTGSYHMGDFGSRTIPASNVNNYNYIHFVDNSSLQSPETDNSILDTETEKVD